MNNNNTHPLSEFNRNRTFVCPGDGTLSHEAVEAIDAATLVDPENAAVMRVMSDFLRISDRGITR